MSAKLSCLVVCFPITVSSSLPRHPAVISHRPRAVCSRACGVCLAILEKADIHEQRINIKFCFKLGKTFRETYKMMKNVYGISA
jgi:hypothetical protein